MGGQGRTGMLACVLDCAQLYDKRIPEQQI
jgi:hypothetical protein